MIIQQHQTQELKELNVIKEETVIKYTILLYC